MRPEPVTIVAFVSLAACSVLYPLNDVVETKGAGGSGGSGGSETGGGGGSDVGGTGTGGSSAAGGSSGSGGGSGGCPDDPLLIDDMEHDVPRICLEDGGYWFTYSERDGVMLTPPKDADFEYTSIPGGRGDSRSAVYFVAEGVSTDDWGMLGIGGLRAGNTGELPYDATAYGGISLYARGAGRVRVRLPTTATTPAPSGRCDDPDCYNDRHFIIDDLDADDWQLYELPFASFVHPYGPEREFDVAELLGIQFSTDGADVELWVDDLRFLECRDNELNCQGLCVDSDSDTEHCGDCDTACSPGQECVGGTCMCLDGEDLCGDGCADLQTSTAHCGMCDQGCASGEFCQDGSCACDEGALECAVGCVDSALDNAHCGSCTNVCRATEMCVPMADLTAADCVLIQENFEASGAQGWVDPNASVGVVSYGSSDVMALAGAQSLQVNVNLDASVPVRASASVQKEGLSGVLPGTVIRFNAWVPESMWVNSYIAHGDDWDLSAADPPPEIVYNTWNSWTQTVPLGASPVQAIGVSFGPTKDASYIGSFYIDAITWSGP